ncbi:MAG: InlB B-repeat-containing protein [Treponema sp.]|nr:InlB B-repeat-containing protein [Treponema sp.]
MKKNVFSVFVLAGLFLLFGCNGIISTNEDETTNKETATSVTVPDDGKAYLCVTKVQTTSARTALPSFSQDSIGDFAFTLTGTKVGGTEQTIGEYESLSDLTENAIAVEAGTWNLTLTAHKDGTILKGEITEKEITAGENSLSFTLAWDETALSGTGSLNFVLDFSAAKNFSAVKAATGELLSYNSETAQETALASYAEQSLEITSGKATYTLTNVAAGNYRIKIRLYADTEKTSLINIWRELAIVTGGQESTASRAMTSLNTVYSITYNADGGTPASGTTLPESYTRLSEEITLPSLSKTGYAFGGWYKNADFTGEAVSKIPSGSTGDITLYAKWSQAAVSVEITDPSASDITLSYETSGTQVTFTATGGSGTYSWVVDDSAQSETSSTFVLETSSLGYGTYTVEVTSGTKSATSSIKVTPTLATALEDGAVIVCAYNQTKWSETTTETITFKYESGAYTKTAGSSSFSNATLTFDEAENTLTLYFTDDVYIDTTVFYLNTSHYKYQRNYDESGYATSGATVSFKSISINGVDITDTLTPES